MRILLALLATGALVLLSGFASEAASSENFCRLASSGMFEGQWMKHRILLQDDVLFGANDMETVRTGLHNLRQEGICR